MLLRESSFVISNPKLISIAKKDIYALKFKDDCELYENQHLYVVHIIRIHRVCT